MKIISGGQTGADRAGAEAALMTGLSLGGWAPNGFQAEDGRIPERYAQHMIEHRGSYAARTKENVKLADAVLVLSMHPVDSLGTKLTCRLALEYNRPCVSFNPLDGERGAGFAMIWIAQYKPKVLMVAGPRESKQWGLEEAGTEYMIKLIEMLREQKIIDA